MNHIFLNPREWSVGDAAQPNFVFSQGPFPQIGFPQEQVSAERTFINDFDGELVEVITLGGWNEQHAEVVSKVYRLTPDTEYSFVFWLNGGENDKSTETCLLKVDFSGGPGSAGYSNVYKLNRNYIKPRLHCQGWELYVIKFRTPGGVSEAEAVSDVGVRFTFVSGAAPMAVKPAREPDFYKDWKDEPDEFAAQRPQRHNIVFEDGWPSIYMYGGNKYSTEILRRLKGNLAAGKGKVQGGTGGSPSFRGRPEGDSRGFRKTDDPRGGLEERFAGLKQEFQALRDRYQEFVPDEGEEADLDEKFGRFDSVEDLLGEMEDRLSEAEDMVDEAEDVWNEVAGQMEEVARQLEEMAAGLQGGLNPKD